MHCFFVFDELFSESIPENRDFEQALMNSQELYKFGDEELISQIFAYSKVVFIANEMIGFCSEHWKSGEWLADKRLYKKNVDSLEGKIQMVEKVGNNLRQAKIIDRILKSDRNPKRKWHFFIYTLVLLLLVAIVILSNLESPNRRGNLLEYLVFHTKGEGCTISDAKKRAIELDIARADNRGEQEALKFLMNLSYSRTTKYIFGIPILTSVCPSGYEFR